MNIECFVQVRRKVCITLPVFSSNFDLLTPCFLISLDYLLTGTFANSNAASIGTLIGLFSLPNLLTIYKIQLERLFPTIYKLQLEQLSVSTESQFYSAYFPFKTRKTLRRCNQIRKYLD